MDNEATKQPKPHGPTGKLILLINIAFFAGASIMLIELSANRVLSPWFGNTLFTWTGLIGVILLAMSGGYYFGGWLADRKPSFTVLGHLLLGSAGLTLLVPVISPSLTAVFGKDTNIILGPVLASLVLFAVPGFLLGTVSPFAIRLTSMATADKKVGTSAGLIGMFSTLGSVIGTFAAGFLLIPTLGIRIIFTLVGVLLALLAVLAYLQFMQRRKDLATTLGGTALLITCLSILTAMTAPGPEPGVIYDHDNFYHRVRVLEENSHPDGPLRTLMLDTTPEGSQYAKTGEPSIPYQSYWELSKVFCPGLERAAFLGAGAFAMPEGVCDAFPGSVVDVVDIDPEVIAVGRKYFRVDDYPQMNPIAMDARMFLANTDETYDLIFGDAYNGLRAIPAHLVTAEFFGQVKDRLNPDGVYMMNIVSAYEGDRATLFKAIARTLSGSFTNIEVFAIDPSLPGAVQNLLLVASDREIALTLDGVETGSREDWIRFLLNTHLKPSRYNYANALVLTDACNPVDLIIAEGLMLGD